jgi:hypothetical protein
MKENLTEREVLDLTHVLRDKIYLLIFEFEQKTHSTVNAIKLHQMTDHQEKRVKTDYVEIDVKI